MELLKFAPDDLADAAESIGAMHTLLIGGASLAAVEEQLESLKWSLEIVEREADRLRFPTTAAQCKAVRSYCGRKPNHRKLGQMLEELMSRLSVELQSRKFFVLPIGQDEYYENNRFSEAAQSAFPEAASDMWEAGNCYALGRDTACVFHLMRVTEAGLTSISRRLALSDANPSWKVVIDAVNKKLKDESAFRPPHAKREQQFLSHCATHMHSIKIAWRNKVMHLEQKYTSDEAQRIFHATLALMDYLAMHP